MAGRELDRGGGDSDPLGPPRAVLVGCPSRAEFPVRDRMEIGVRKLTSARCFQLFTTEARFHPIRRKEMP